MKIIISEVSFIGLSDLESKMVCSHLDKEGYEHTLLDNDPSHVMVFDHLDTEELEQLTTDINNIIVECH